MNDVTSNPDGAALARRTRLTLWLLLGVCILNFVDRQIVNILAEPIRRELGLSDTQLGLLAGLAFALFYAVLGIPIARYADRGSTNRVGLIAVSLALWSGMTAVCGLAQSFGQLLLARVGVGVGEAGCTPAALSLIADSVPRERRASALAFYGMGGPIGALFGMVIGGVLADLLGWRQAFLFVGLPGIGLALVFWLVAPEPRRDAKPQPGSASRGATLAETWHEIRRSRTVAPLLAAGAVAAFLAYGKGVWAAVFFIRTHGLSPTEVGLFLGVIGGSSSALGTWLGGKLADRYGRRDPKHYLTLPALSLALAAPLLFLAYYASDWRAAMALLVVPTIANTTYYGPTMLCLQSVVSPRARAVVVSIQLFTANLIGLGLGPLFFGMLSDQLKAVVGTESVRWSLYGAAFLGVIPAAFFWLASRHLRAEMRGD